MTQTIYSVVVFDNVRKELKNLGTFTNKQVAEKALEDAFHDACDTYLRADEELNASSYQDIDSFVVRDDIDGTDYYVQGEITRTDLVSDYFPVTFVSRDDLEGQGYDTSKVDDSTMERLADKMGDAYCESGYWTDLEILADYLEIPKVGQEDDEE